MDKLLVLFACVSLSCTLAGGWKIGKKTEVAGTQTRPMDVRETLPPMTLEEMSALVREQPKLNCLLSRSGIEVTLTGRLGSFRYGYPELKNGFNICLVGEFGEWRTKDEFCRVYVPHSNHVYHFGSLPLPQKNRERFTFVSLAGGREFRWIGVKSLRSSGACRIHIDENGNTDLLEFRPAGKFR